MKNLDKIITTKSRVLILGTMPGKKSLELDEYYANPRNQFWGIMDYLVEGISNLEYKKKISLLNEKGIALWDVLLSCEREGSLDSKIKKGTEKPNDFQEFFDRNKNLRTVIFNGKSKRSAYRLFRKIVLPTLRTETKSSLILIPLPSSSSANTHQTLQEKAEEWMKISDYLTK